MEKNENINRKCGEKHTNIKQQGEKHTITTKLEIYIVSKIVG